MKPINLTATVLLAALTVPALAENEPDQADAEIHRQVEWDLVEPDITTSRAMTPEEAERWGINDLIVEIKRNWPVPEQLEPKPREFIRGPFLGVNAKPLDLDTAKELGLKQSTGLLVNYVAGGGPASVAGLKKGDVLTKLNDQVLVNAEQFAVLVRSHAIGDTVTVHGLRDSRPIKLEAKLGEADVSPLGPGGRDLDQAWRVQLNPLNGPVGNPLRPEVEIAPGLWIGDGWGAQRRMMLDDEAMSEQMREMIKKLEQQMFRQRQDIDDRMQQLRLQLDLDIEKLREGMIIPQGDDAAQKQLQAAMMWSDGTHKIRIANNNGVSQLTVKDREDKVLYDGPLPEDGRVEGLPKDVQQKVDQLLNNTRIEQRILPEPQPEQREAPPQT